MRTHDPRDPTSILRGENLLEVSTSQAGFGAGGAEEILPFVGPVLAMIFVLCVSTFRTERGHGIGTEDKFARNGANA